MSPLISRISSATALSRVKAPVISGGGGLLTGTLKLLIASPDTASWINDVSTNITSAVSKYPGLTLNITVQSGSTSLPSISSGQYDVAFIWSNNTLNWNSTFQTANSAGMGIVTAQFYGSTGISGVPSNLMPTVNGSGGQSAGGLTWPGAASALIANHPIVYGAYGTSTTVNSFNTGTFSATNPSLSSGAQTVINATLGTSYPLVVVQNFSAPQGRTVWLNFFPPSSNARSDFWNVTAYPDGSLLMLNSLIWAARRM